MDAAEVHPSVVTSTVYTPDHAGVAFGIINMPGLAITTFVSLDVHEYIPSTIGESIKRKMLSP